MKNGKFIRDNMNDFFDCKKFHIEDSVTIMIIFVVYNKMKQNTKILIGLVAAISGYENSQKKKDNLETLCRPFALTLVENIKAWEQNPHNVSIILRC